LGYSITWRFSVAKPLSPEERYAWSIAWHAGSHWQRDDGEGGVVILLSYAGFTFLQVCVLHAAEKL
jgi:hypothetical protein